MMDCDAILDQLLESAPADVVVAKRQAPEPDPLAAGSAHKRDRLAALAAGGRAGQYIGAQYARLTVEQVEALPDAEIEKLYARHEARLGSAITKTLGTAVLQTYAQVASLFLPIADRQALVTDLAGDPFLDHALNTLTCELYHKFGMCLAPATVAIATMRHCRFGHVCPRNDNHGGDADSPHAGDDAEGPQEGGGWAEGGCC